MRDDFEFQAELSRGRRELRQAVEARLLSVAGRAVDAIEQALGDGDSRAAIQVLKGLGFLRGEAHVELSDDPEELRRRHVADVAQRESLNRLLDGLSV